MRREVTSFTRSVKTKVISIYKLKGGVLFSNIFLFLFLIFQVTRLIYTNSGYAILALATNAVHKLWKWPRNERNPTGKVLVFITLTLFGNNYHFSSLCNSIIG